MLVSSTHLQHEWVGGRRKRERESRDSGVGVDHQVRCCCMVHHTSRLLKARRFGALFG